MNKDGEHRVFVFNFSRTFVNVVNYVIHPEYGNEPEKSPLFSELLKPLRTFLDRYKMELYFVFAEELVRFDKGLNEENLKELFKSMINDLQEDKYDAQVFSWYCVVLSYYAAIAKRRNVATDLKMVVRILMDAILYFEKDNETKVDVIEDVKNSLKKTAQLIDEQTKSGNHETLEPSIIRH